MLKKFLFRLLAAALALVAAAAVGEIALRLLPVGTPPRDITVRHPPANSPREEPDFRRRLPNLDLPALRIVFVGDSFTWGAGVWPEDTYPARVQRQLAPRAVDRLQVVVWSRPGWNTRLEWQSFKEAQPDLDPDVVVLAYCLNDAEPSQVARRQEIWREGGWWPGDEPSPGWLSRRSRLAGRIRSSLLNLRSRRAARAYYHRIYDEDSPAWQQNRRALLKFGELARGESGPRFLLVIFPIFDSPLDGRYPYRQIHQRLAALAAEHGIATLDLLARYEGIDTRRLAAHPFTDPHPNELAHRLAAEWITDELVERGWVPLRPSSPSVPIPPGSDGDD